MKIEIRHQSPKYPTYRAACVHSLFNVENTDFSLSADLPLDEEPWRLGAVVGPSGSGKSSLGAAIWGPEAVRRPEDWPDSAPIIEAITPEADWTAVTSALSAVGLGSVPAWLRPYQSLSTGERFRADLARIIMDCPEIVVIDEFTSVVDRQIARIGAAAFGKAWRRSTIGQAVVLSCHYDILDWLTPDWVFDTAEGRFYWARGRLRRPAIKLEIYETNWQFWPLFAPHHYLNLPPMIAATCYIGFVGDQPVAHLGVSTMAGFKEARACRLVVMPEWQGAGVGLAFLEAVCAAWRRGENRYGRPMRTIFHTSHPGLAAALRQRRGWTQISAALTGDDKARCRASLAKSAQKTGRSLAKTGFGGHFRAVQGFRYLGEE